MISCSRVSQVADYDVQFKESGTQYTEKIQVNTDKQTELFKVPAHNDVDGSNILHDFKAVSLFFMSLYYRFLFNE